MQQASPLYTFDKLIPVLQRYYAGDITLSDVKESIEQNNWLVAFQLLKTPDYFSDSQIRVSYTQGPIFLEVITFISEHSDTMQSVFEIMDIGLKDYINIFKASKSNFNYKSTISDKPEFIANFISWYKSEQHAAPTFLDRPSVTKETIDRLQALSFLLPPLDLTQKYSHMDNVFLGRSLGDRLAILCYKMLEFMDKHYTNDSVNRYGIMEHIQKAYLELLSEEEKNILKIKPEQTQLEFFTAIYDLYLSECHLKKFSLSIHTGDNLFTEIEEQSGLSKRESIKIGLEKDTLEASLQKSRSVMEPVSVSKI